MGLADYKIEYRRNQKRKIDELPFSLFFFYAEFFSFFKCLILMESGYNVILPIFGWPSLPDWLFLWWRVGAALSSCSAWVSRCGGLSCCGARALHRRLQELGNMGSEAVVPRLYSMGSTAVVRGLSSSLASGIFPGQGLKLCLLDWYVESLPLSPLGCPLSLLCKYNYL